MPTAAGGGGVSNGGTSVSQKWLIGLLTAMLLTGGAGWMTNIHGQLKDISADRDKQRERDATTREDTAVIREKVGRLERDLAEFRADQQAQGKKLDELLARVRSLR